MVFSSPADQMREEAIGLLEHEQSGPRLMFYRLMRNIDFKATSLEFWQQLKIYLENY